LAFAHSSRTEHQLGAAKTTCHSHTADEAVVGEVMAYRKAQENEKSARTFYESEPAPYVAEVTGWQQAGPEFSCSRVTQRI
jgi:hypothetical protein